MTRILAVDDERLYQHLLEVNLQKEGFEVITAGNGLDALEMVTSRQPDLVIMDIMMPKMDGLEATRIIKADAKTRHIPIIALTSYAMKGDRERTIEAGCNGYMAKPIDIQEVLKTIEHYLQ